MDDRTWDRWICAGWDEYPSPIIFNFRPVLKAKEYCRCPGFNGNTKGSAREVCNRSLELLNDSVGHFWTPRKRIGHTENRFLSRRPSPPSFLSFDREFDFRVKCLEKLELHCPFPREEAFRFDNFSSPIFVFKNEIGPIGSNLDPPYNKRKIDLTADRKTFSGTLSISQVHSDFPFES
jgi:hypothetical protein